MNIGQEIIPAPQNDMVKLTDNIIANKWNSEVFASKKKGHSPKWLMPEYNLVYYCRVQSTQKKFPIKQI